MSGPAGLQALEARVAHDLDAIAHPRKPWLEPRTGPAGEPILDVLIVGGGQSGLAIAFGLRRAQVTNVLVVDKAPYGLEGPWRTYARMRTLRSPKDFTGPDLDVPSLTYQAWHEARFGRRSWEALDLIEREHWADYLLWFRQVTALPVENGVAVEDIRPAGEVLAAAARGPDETVRTILARKIVLATGQEGTGRWATPSCLLTLPPEVRACAADPIDFDALRGKHVAVIGAGASALDNAASALEAGASVDVLCRRAEIQLVQPYRWLTFAGFLRHVSDLDDAWRWRFMARVMALREGFPQPTWDRCARHPGFTLREASPVLAASVADGRAVLTTPAGCMSADFVISAVGIEMNFAARPEFAAFADNIATWSDRYTPPHGEENERFGGFPYLRDDYSFAEKEPGRTPWIGDVHLFAIGSTMSFGPSGSSINAMTTAVPKLVSGLTRGLFRADIHRHWREFGAYDVPQAAITRPAETAATGPGTRIAKTERQPVADESAGPHS